MSGEQSEKFCSVEWKNCLSNGHFGNGVKLFPADKFDQAYGYYLCFVEREEQMPAHGTVELWLIDGNMKTLSRRLEKARIQCSARTKDDALD